MPIKLIKDPVVGNIEFSKFESRIFSNQLFNRLHYVMQNSMAFKVFPACKTSRFSHSIGVMQISSLMFKNGLANAKQDVLGDYLKSKLKVIKGLINLSELDGTCGERIDQYCRKKHITIAEGLYNNLPNIIGETFINHVTFYNEIFFDKSLTMTYLILIQTLRTVALLHDIGHLPFSHLAEYAIESVEAHLLIKEEKECIAQNEKEKLDIIKKLTSDPENDKIHEVIGGKVIDAILYDIANSEKKDYEDMKDEDTWFNLFICLIKKMIFTVKGGIVGDLSSLYSIISNDLDADRLDFVMRDGLSSGLIDKTGDNERIIKLYCLCRDDTKLKDKFVFLPAIQSLNDVQEVLLDRFRIYKYLINHHKVRKIDYFVQLSIELMMKIELYEEKVNLLSIEKEELKKLDSLNLDRFIDLLKVAGKAFSTENLSYERFSYQFSQFTENWALSIMNKMFINFLLGNIDSSTDDEMEKNLKILKIILVEIFKSSKKFISLWKRDHEYNDFMLQLDSKLVKENLKDRIEILTGWCGNTVDSKSGAESDKSIRKEAETAFKIVNHLNNTYNTSWTRNIEKRFYDQGEFVFINIPKLSTGIDELQLVDLKNQDNKYNFKVVSRVFNYLRNELDSSIKFLVFFRNDDTKDDKIKKEKIKEELIAHLKNYIIEKCEEKNIN